jgi:uncharacterized protein
MIQLAQGYFRKTLFKTYRWFKHPRKLKKSPVRRWFATHFLSKQVWKPTQHTLSGGLAIGMFAMIQLIPGQMGIAALGAAIFRVNIPIAIIACWVSNPFTFVPFGYAQKLTGDFMHPYLPSFFTRWINGFAHFLIHNFERLPAFIRDIIPADFLAKGVDFLTSMYVGGIVIGLALIPISYVICWLTWEYFHRVAVWRRARDIAAAQAAL